MEHRHVNDEALEAVQRARLGVGAASTFATLIHTSGDEQTLPVTAGRWGGGVCVRCLACVGDHCVLRDHRRAAHTLFKIFRRSWEEEVEGSESHLKFVAFVGRSR